MTLHLPTILPRVLLLAFAPATIPAAPAPVPPPPNPLVWDAMEKTVTLAGGATEAKFEFDVTNASAAAVEISAIDPSCGCTVAEMPSTPWILAPGVKSSFSAVVDVRGKHGMIAKSLTVHSGAGAQVLKVVINVPETEESRRERNQQLAFVDRQAVFRGECASCHVLPLIGKTGGELFQAACGICHLAIPRAAMVPDLTASREPRDASYWQTWIANGKEHTLMPAFAAKQGGPLTDEQVGSLVTYLMARFRTELRAN